ncbi:hypothetical protein [Chryseobacterium indologenes]|uniref:hypothetical protein n=1 Tax=Chryseobacterium indologenes TaxID=253 RepID=UPI001E2C9CA7|nr:hypothetical protein [Chryseobacterium indologenes]
MFKYSSYLFTFLLFSFLSWNYYGIFFLVNIILLFFIIDTIKDKSFGKKILYVYPFFLSLNVGVTFWLYQSDPLYSIITFISNALIMTFFFIMANLPLWKNTKVAFIIIWFASEIILTKWDLSWPWLIFGNVLSNQWYLIQWYSFTGVYGGSLWLLLLAFIIYMLITEGYSRLRVIMFLLCLIFPLLSLVMYNWALPETKEKETIILYTPDAATFGDSSYQKTRTLLSVLSQKKVDKRTKIITTELFFQIKPYDLIHGNIHYLMDSWMTDNDLTFVMGSQIENDSANKFNGISVINKRNTMFRTKKKYVPVSEYTPKLLVPMFGKSFYVKNQDDDSKRITGELNTFPFVCYEILFSDFVAQKTSDVNMIMVLASEEFMNGSFFGSLQYNNIIRIRAIENSRYLIKNSFLGKSLVVNPKGDIIDVMSSNFHQVTVPVYQKNSFYQMLVTKLFSQE